MFRVKIDDFLDEVALNIEDYSFTSKKYKANPEVVFVIGDEKVKAYKSAANEAAPSGGATEAPTT